MGLFSISAAKKLSTTSLSKILHMEEALSISERFDESGMQESVRFRAFFFARCVADILIRKSGKFDLNKCVELASLIQDSKHYVGPYLLDREIIDHIHQILLFFLQNKKAREKLHHFDRLNLPEKIRKWIAASLGGVKEISDRLVRVSILSATLTPLRQNIGSCFATAPCIYIQRYETEKLLNDLYDLIYIGKIQRVVDGTEYQIPLNPSIGSAELNRPFISFDPEKISTNPALIFACETVHLLDPNSSLASKQKELFLLLQDKSYLSVKELIQSLLKEQAPKEDKNEKIYSPTPSLRLQSQAFEKRRDPQIEEAFLTFTSATEHPLLKMWEYTLASMSDARQKMTIWNLFQSLGLNLNQTEGIGYLWKEVAFTEIEKEKEGLSQLESEYQSTYDKAKAAQALSMRGSSEMQSAQWQAEWKMLQRSLNTLGDLVAEKRNRCERLYQIPALLVEQSIHHFPAFFQELYDPDIEEIDDEILEDSPAGFRLYYKHGREEPTLWTPIENKEQFVYALSDCFRLMESRWDLPPEMSDELSSFITEAILWLKRAEFSEAINKKSLPWTYVSGGSMEALLQVYYGREKEWLEVESEGVDSFHIASFQKNIPEKPLLMTSLHHAFIYRGDLWKKNKHDFDQLPYLSHHFYEQIVIKKREEEYLISLLKESYPLSRVPNHILSAHTELPLLLWREHIIQVLDQLFPQKGEKMTDSFLFSHLPLQPFSTIEKFLEGMGWHYVMDQHKEKCFFSSEEFLSFLSYFCAWQEKSLFSRKDLLQTLVVEAKKQFLLYPYSITFAETNWPGKWFAWVCPPASLTGKLWVTDSFGISGFPMKEELPKKKEGWIAYMEKNGLSL